MKAKDLIEGVNIPGYGDESHEGEFNQPSIKFMWSTDIGDYETPIKYSLLMGGFTPSEVNQITIDSDFIDSDGESAQFELTISGPEALMAKVSKHFAGDVEEYRSEMAELEDEDAEYEDDQEDEDDES